MKADLHIHTKFSARAADWLLRKLEFPASMTDPRDLHAKLKKSGMDFVTFTDHNTIAAFDEVKDLPNLITGEEVTTTFPEDECRIHLLVWGLTPSQHDEIQSLAPNIYNLQQYLLQQNLTHAVAHPLHSPNDKLTNTHLQKLILLFKHFETLNGRYHARLGEILTHTLQSLTPEKIRQFEKNTRLTATHPEPWRKIFIAGSNDLGGLHYARAYTETPPAATPQEFLEHILAGRCKPSGRGGEPLTMAHGIYQTAFSHIRKNFTASNPSPGSKLLEKAFTKIIEGRDPTNFTLIEKLSLLSQSFTTGKILELATLGTSPLLKEISTFLSCREIKEEIARLTAQVNDPGRKTFLLANLLANQLGYRLFKQFLTKTSQGQWLEGLQTLSPLAIIIAAISPYLQAFRHPRRDSLRSIVSPISDTTPPPLLNKKRAWFTDTLDDVNGVATTIRTLASALAKSGRDIVVMTSRAKPPQIEAPLLNFPPVGEFHLPEYEIQSLSFPPVLNILDELNRGNYTEAIISTPGPVGLAALYAARTLGLRTIGIYHTDFPQYVRILTEDAFLESLTWDYMHWFYSQFDTIYLNSQDYKNSWASRGIPPDRMKILPRGVDLGMFNPSRQNPNFWPARGLKPDETLVLYVGRISKEKNLDIFAATIRTLQKSGLKIRPALVGDGPYLKAIKKSLPDAITTGYLQGPELASAYASADIFLFPSTTDTFGNVVLEAQACGTPPIVSDIGGPKDLVQNGHNGFITKAHDLTDLTAKIRLLTENKELLQKMGENASQSVKNKTWHQAATTFWENSPL